MFNKTTFIIVAVIINMIVSVCASVNVFAAANLAIYTSVAPTVDASGNVWVYFGTGDKTDPGATTSGQEKLYAIKDSDRTSTYTLTNLMDVSGTSTSYPVYDPNSTTYHGWYITLAGTAEKILAAPVVYDKKVYFTTYTPSSVACDQNGIAKLYIVNYLTGEGELSSSTLGSGSGTSNAARSENVGYGIPAGPVISTNPYSTLGGGSGSGSGSSGGGSGSGTVIPGYNVYVSTSAANYGTGSSTIVPNDTSPQSGQGKYMIYWRDNRLQ